MKIIVKKDLLAKGISKVISSVNPRSTLPILSNLLFETIGKEQIKITGTDLEIGIIHTIDADIQEEGAITLPAKKFSDIVREAPEQNIEISVTKNNAVSIKSGKAYFKLMGLTKEDYPKFPEVHLENALMLDNEILRECINLTAFAISSDETRYVLNGALLIIKDKKIKMVATDGRRLAVIEKDSAGKKGTKLEVIIPTKAIHEIQKNTQEEGMVGIVEMGNQLVFSFGKTVIISRLIEGHYPNYEQVIPKEEKIVVKINKEMLLGTLRRVSLLTSLESQAVKIDLIKNEKLVLSSRAPNLGESKEEIDVEVLQGGEITMGFNPTYMTDVLKSLSIDEIVFGLSDPDKPGVVRGKEGYVYVIMPMQVG